MLGWAAALHARRGPRHARSPGTANFLEDCRDEPATDARVPLLRRGRTRLRSSSLGQTPLANALLTDGAAGRAGGDATRSTSCSARLHAGADHRDRAARGAVPRLRLLLVLLRHDAAPRRDAGRPPDDASAASAPAALVVESPATTATCCSTTSARASRCSASSRRATSPGSPRGARHPHRRRVLRRRAGARSWPRAEQRADVIHANNVLAHVADLNGFVARRAPLPEGRRRRRHRGALRQAT